MSSKSTSTTGRGKNKVPRHGSIWEEWGGYMAAKRQKLDDQFTANKPMETEKEGDSSSIFRGVTIHVNGYTKPSSDELKRLMMLHGGRYEHYMSKTRVTHVIATSLANTKVKDFKHMKIVRPEWITDSVKAKRLLSCVPYLLYTAQTGIQHGLTSYTSTSTTPHSTNTSSMTSDRPSVQSGDHDLTGMHQDLESLTSTIVMQKSPIQLQSFMTNDHKKTSPNEEDIYDFQNEIDNELATDEKKSYQFTENYYTGTHSRKCVLSTDGKRETDLKERQDEKMQVDVCRSVSFVGGNVTKSLHKGKEKKPVPAVTKSPSAKTTSSHSPSPVPAVTKSPSTKTTSSHSPSPVPAVTKSPSAKTTSSHSPSKAGDPNFLSEFYNNSRLHHLSTWKSEWRTYVNKLQKQGSSFPGRDKLLALVKQRADEVSKRVSFPVTTVSGKPSRVIMHIDMDSFFVSVGLRNRPELRGKPIAVTHSRGKGMPTENPGSDFKFESKQWDIRRQQGGKKGKRKSLPVSDQPSLDDMIDDADEKADDDFEDVTNKQNESYTGQTFHSLAEIASCSYEARKAGVKNGMFMGKAKQLCPDLVTIPYDFDGYQEVSKLLYDTVASYTHDIEAVSCDEMLVDCTDLLAVTGAEPLDFAKLLREEIYNKSGCTASAGIGSNILLAKMATKRAKPNGQYFLHPDEVLEFISDQSIDNIPGVGWSMSRKLHDMRVTTCGDLQKVPMSVLQSEFGNKTGQSLHDYCRGRDSRPIKVEQERKSVSAEINYGIRLKNDVEAEHFLNELCGEVHNRLVNIGMKGKSITLKIMARRPDAPMETAKFMGHGICNSTSKSVTLPIATDDSKIISRECIAILHNMKVKATDLRGIGIQVQKLEPVNVTNGGVKGAQSILNFAVPKTNVKDKLKSAATKSVDCITEHKMSDTTVDDDIPILSPVQLDHQTTNDDHHDLDLPDLTNGEQEVLDMPHGIVEELARRKTAKKILPPLPAMPDLSLTPEDDVPLTASGRPRRTKRSTHPVTLSEDYFPSPSQIDPEVLKELPPDVRKQIENEIKSRQKKKKVRPVISPDNSQRPGCSHWSKAKSTSASQSVENGSENQTNDAIVPLPSPSQLDESCLNALPVDLQKELRDAYAFQTEQENSKLSNHVTSSWLHQTKSPPKKRPSPQKSKSPGKGKKNSPVFKVPNSRPSRGRKKLSPKKLNFQRQPKIDVAVSGRKDSLPVLDAEHNAITSNHATSPTERKSVNLVKAQTCVNTTHKPVNLCGAVSIEEVRNLLREWLQSSLSPEAEDEEMMIEYLRDLVFDYNLEKVDLVVKFLNRNIRKLNSVRWMFALKNIVNAVQIVVQSMYGSRLALPDGFELPDG